MDSKQIRKLQSINDFPELLDYLRDELDWPIEDFEFDELTFDYTPEELGIDEHNAAKILEIKRLRPLDDHQPWGIFFVSLEPKQLPVVALRRLLSTISLKKRASANKADQAVWHHDDILFISNFGKHKERQLSFAHFSVNEEKHDLPVLKVLGWDNRDTKLHVDAVVETLKEKLLWPEDVSDVDSWRQQWRDAFTLRHREVVSTSKEMAIRLAELARNIRDSILSVLEVESEKGPLRQIMDTFREALIHDLDEPGFADMYAQTIAYGLLSARIADPQGSNTVEHLGDHMRTNPFLRELMETFLDVGGRKRGRQKGAGLDFDELGVSEVVDLLDSANMEAVVRDFGDRNRQEDPVMHFYESFLHEYNKQLKVQRGVFYTPQPVVSYIVRSVHELLQTEFGLEDGLADTTTWGEMLYKRPDMKLPPLTDEPGEKRTISRDEPFVQILDPATGTATFLVEVIGVIYKTMSAKWKRQGKREKAIDALWNDYVPQHLLPRLHAYELMMAPYAIAHMKVGLKLAETGYLFEKGERARIYLTNALEPWQKQLKLPEFDALAHEAAAVNEIKNYKSFTVVIGNPPYANYSANLSPEARRIVDKYRKVRGAPIRERNQLQFERNLQDDFVKFISIAQDLISGSSMGVLSYITNGTMLASSSLRGMRESLQKEFSSIFELNLHGGGNELIEGDEDDENVFDIVQSVAIHVYARSQSGGSSEVHYADLLGTREAKYAALGSSSLKETEWQRIQPDAENSGFTPQDEHGGGVNRRLDSSFVKFGAGIKTNRDAVVIGFDENSLLEKLREHDAKLASSKDARNSIYSLLYRPFDIRKIFYHEDVIASRSLPTMKNMIAGPNIGFVCSSTWTTPDRFSVGVSRLMVEMKTGTHDRGTTFFPLYRYEALMGAKPGQVHNFTTEFVNDWCTTTRTTFLDAGHGDGEATTGPEDVLFWLYGLFYSAEYRRRYRVALSQGFPIVLFPSDLEFFRALAKLGRELVALHLLEATKQKKPMTKFIGRNRLVTKVGWTPDDGGTVWLDGKGTAKKFQSGTTGFRPVPKEVWNIYFGGYQVCEKWLKDRGPKKGNPGRTLTDEDIAHYHKIVIALSETMRIMAEIDEVIESHGGWPGAFVTGQESSDSAENSVDAYELTAEAVEPDLFDKVADSDADTRE